MSQNNVSFDCLEFSLINVSFELTKIVKKSFAENVWSFVELQHTNRSSCPRASFGSNNRINLETPSSEVSKVECLFSVKLSGMSCY